MKPSIDRAILSFALALPLSLLMAGCKEKTESTSPLVEANRASEGAMANADNTSRNVRDRNDSNPTPFDQGTTPEDREMTQKIRKALVIEESGYSVTAKNIKIITTNGKVTLRGPVKSEAEKAGILALAKNVAGPANVKDDLEVKTNP